MGSVNYQAGDYRSWEAAGLKDFGDFAECISEVDIRPDGFDVTAGTWFYADESTLTIYWGTWGNYNSPGASHYTYAEVFDDREEFDASLAEWEAKPEYDPDHVETYEVVVGNVGTVYEGGDRWEADREFDDYVQISKEDATQRAYGESVTMLVRTKVFCDMIQEHVGHLAQD